MIKTNLTDLTPARERYKVQIKLPSSGYVFPSAFPDGMLTVYPWAPELDDWVAKRTESSAKTIIQDLLPKLCDLNGCPTDKFIISEALLVWMVSRSIKSDRKVAFNTKCPKCGESSDMTICVPEDMELIGEKLADYCGFETLHLAQANDDITFSPTTVGQSRLVITRPQEQRKHPDAVVTLAVSLRRVNNTAPDNLSEACEYVAALSPLDYEAFKTGLEKAMPGVDNNLSLSCDACGFDYKHTLNFTETFFR